ncbi:MAG: hypothetical protein AAGA03_09540 [Planctomycetota bacterium]
MKLPVRSVRKLLREGFSGSQPIFVSPSDFGRESKTWRACVRSIQGVKLTQHPGDRDSRSKTICRFTIPDPSEAYEWRSNEIRLERADNGALTIRVGHPREGLDATVSDPSEIERFVREVLARYARRQAKAKKSEKVRDLKIKAIRAQIKKLAKEESFDFATAADERKFKLFVNLSAGRLVEIYIPFSRFDEVLSELRNTLHAIRGLDQKGIQFRIGNRTSVPWSSEWVKHEDL